MRWILVNSLILACFFSGCSDDEVGNPNLDIPDEGRDGTGDTEADASDDRSPADGDVTDEELDLPEPGLAGAGWIVVSSYAYSIGEQNVSGYSVIATFEGPDVAGVDQDTCTEREEGTCRVTECHDNGEGSSPPPRPKPHAGAISVNGGAERVTLVPGDSGTYPVRSSSEDALFVGGETLNVSAAGGDVPSFTVELAAPTSLTLTSPEIPINPTPWVIEKEDDLLLEWTGGAGSVEVLLFTPTGHVSCQFDAEDASGTVTSAAIQSLSGSGTYLPLSTT